MKKISYIILVTIIIISCGFLSAFLIIKVDRWRVIKSKEYLYKAENTQSEGDKLLYYEKAAILEANENTFIKSGITALHLNDFRLAEKYLTRVKTNEGYFELGNAYYNLNKFDQAIVSYSKSVGIKERPEYQISLGKSYLKIGDIDNASKLLEASYRQKQTVELDRLLRDLGSNLIVVGVETDPANNVILAVNDLNTLGYPQSAERLLSDALASGKLNRNSLITLANRDIENKRYEGGYALLQRARANDPYYPQIYQQLVVVCRELGKVEEVRQYQEFYNNLVF